MCTGIPALLPFHLVGGGGRFHAPASLCAGNSENIAKCIAWPHFGPYFRRCPICRPVNRPTLPNSVRQQWPNIPENTSTISAYKAIHSSSETVSQRRTNASYNVSCILRSSCYHGRIHIHRYKWGVCHEVVVHWPNLCGNGVRVCAAEIVQFVACEVIYKGKMSRALEQEKDERGK